MHLRRQSTIFYSLKNFIEIDYSLRNSKLKLNIIGNFLDSNRIYTAVLGSLNYEFKIGRRVYS